MAVFAKYTGSYAMAGKKMCWANKNIWNLTQETLVFYAMTGRNYVCQVKIFEISQYK